MSEKKSLKREALKGLIPVFEENPNALLIVEDCGFAAVDELRKKCPNQVLNIGIMEQATISIATGMFAGGMLPIVYGIARFVILRAADQIHMAVKQKFPLKIIGVGADNYFQQLGHSHTAGMTDAIVANQLGMHVLNATEESLDIDKQLSRFLNPNHPVYLRTL